MRVFKWGDGLAIRIPATVVEALTLKEDDDIDIQVADDRAFALRKSSTRKELIARLSRYSGKLPKGFKFDREGANTR